jgi:dTDP-glucose 4,6-dehydratase
LKYLVAGGAGFIGSNFVKNAFANPDEFELDSILVLDSLTYSGNPRNLDGFIADSRYAFVKGDITDRELLDSIIPNVDIVVNFAAESHVDRSISNPGVFFKTNIIGVSTILETLRNNPQKRLVHVSTDEVYGSLIEGSATERSPLKPNSPYAASKASADLLIRSYVKTYELDVVITRCTNNYGPFQFPEKLIPFFISQIVENRQVPVYGNGMNIRDWIHVDDHIEGIRLAALRGKPGGIYNLGSSNELSNLEITNLLLELLGKERNLIVNVEDRLGHDFRYSLNYDYAVQELGFNPKVNFREGLAATINWYLANRGWWEPLLGENLHGRAK